MAYSRSSPWAGVTVARVHRRTPRRYVSICVHRISHAAVWDQRYQFAFMVAERVGRPVLDIPSPHRPGERAAAMDLIPPGTSSEGSDETPRRGSRIRAEEEEQGGVTPISRSSAATGPDHEGSSEMESKR